MILKRTVALCLWIGCAQASSVALRFFTIADGLPRNTINSIWQDSRGFMWFATVEGLSRFDGYRFTNYGLEIGLPRANVLTIIEARNGDYLVGTADGLCRMPASSQPICQVFRPEEPAARVVSVLFEDRGRYLWAGTNGGLYRLMTTDKEVRFECVVPAAETGAVHSIMQDRDGTMWMGTDRGLFQRSASGVLERKDLRNRMGESPTISAVADDDAGQVWAAATPGGLYQVMNGWEHRPVMAPRSYGVPDGLDNPWVQGLLRTRDHRLLVANGRALWDWSEIARQNGGRPRCLLYERAEITALFEDREGGIWVAVQGHGVGRILHAGLTTFTKADGLLGERIDSIFESRAGQLCVLTKIHHGESVTKALGYFDGNRFQMIYPRFPPNTRYYGWGWSQIGFHDQAGDWWFAGGEGLYRFPAVRQIENLASTRPKAVYGKADGLGADDIFRVFEDTRGDVWVGAGSRVSRWDRSSGLFHEYRLAENPPVSEGASAFADDGRGGVWIGYYFSGGVARWRGGPLSRFDPAGGAPTSRPNQMLRDRKGRLWLATSREGVARIDDPAAERPRFRWFTTADGLGSNSAFCLAEDSRNQIYVGHGRGVDRIDPETGSVRRFTSADELVSGELNTCYGASDGTLWFASDAGVSRVVPQPVEPGLVPPVYLTGLQIRGVPRAIALSERESRRFELGPDQNQLQMDFAAVSFREPLRYQYKLEGSGGGWSQPGGARTINFASLPPGDYRFLARAVNSEGVQGQETAFRFSIAPPFWRRWWVELAGALTVALLVYGAHLYRVRYLLGIERVRTHIASDLHDDIGANLSQIAILSEIARGGTQPADGPLETIAQISRDTLRSMGDIIWSVDPERDRVDDLVHRMRRFAGDLFASSGADLHFHASTSAGELGSVLKRQVFLIFKEMLNNVVRHAGATQTVVTVGLKQGVLQIQVTDNGHGFDPARDHEGRGLASMKARAKELNGVLEIRSGQNGTTVNLKVPLSPRIGKRSLHVDAGPSAGKGP